MIATDESCLHHWIIESPSGPWSIATCRKCKKVDAFKNSCDETSWPTPKNEGVRSRENKNKDIPTKEEFITQNKLRDISKITKRLEYKTEFKLRIVQEVNTCGRAKVRKKYKIPETTLRGWIKRFT